MDDDQQFCLRWNNHQSTLVAVFDTLLENGTLVDCTLAAEGKYLNAHKVVLSACSPYFETLLSKHFDKHPIVVLKDVKFQELKAMMDYMYRGEVNISQDQLGALLKAAESLQIKGLSDNKRGETERKPVLPPKSPPTAAQPAPAAALPKVQGLTIEQRAGRDEGREGSASPGPRKKKRMRRKSEEMDNHHDASSSSESHSLPAAHTTVPALLPAISKMSADVPEPVETKSEILTRHKQPTLPDDHNSTPQTQQLPMLKEKIETHTELMLEPKAEYVEEMNEDSIEDLTLDDDDLSNMEQMDEQAGPSHGNAGEGSSQGFGGWHMGNQSQDEVFLAAQEAVGAHRDSQGNQAPEPEYHSNSYSMDDLLTVAETVSFPTLSMSGVFNLIPNQPAPDQPKRSKRVRKIKTYLDEPVIKRTPTIQANKTMLSHYVQYYENKKGEMVKIIRCQKCGGFVRQGQQQCTRCIIKVTKEILGSENQVNLVAPKLIGKHTSKNEKPKDPSKVKVKKQVESPTKKVKSGNKTPTNSKKMQKENHTPKVKQTIAKKSEKKNNNSPGSRSKKSNTGAIGKKVQLSVKKPPQVTKKMVSSKPVKASKVTPKNRTLSQKTQNKVTKSRVKTVSTKIKKPRSKAQSKVNITAPQRKKVKKNNQPSMPRTKQTNRNTVATVRKRKTYTHQKNPVQKKVTTGKVFAITGKPEAMNTDQFVKSRDEIIGTSRQCSQIETVDGSDSAADEKLRLLHYLSLEQQIGVIDINRLQKKNDNKEIMTDLHYKNSKESMSMLLSGPNIEIIQENDED